MRSRIFSVLLFLPFLTWSQAPDSITVVRQVDSLLQLLRPLIENQQLEEAHNVVDAAQEKVLAAFGKNHLKNAGCIAYRGKIYQHQEKYPEAVAAILESLAIQQKIIGRESLPYSVNLSILGSIYLAMGDFVKAQPVLLETLATRSKLLGKEHPDYARALINLGALYIHLADYDKATLSYQDAIAVFAKTLGKRHPDYLRAMANLGSIYFEKGDFFRAEPLFMEVNEGFLALVGKKHPLYAKNALNLATLYANHGDSAKAVPLYLEVIDIYKNSLGKDNVDYYLTLTNLSSIYQKAGDFGTAEPLLLEARDGFLGILGAAHPHYAEVLRRLGTLYLAQRDFARAEPLLLESNAIVQKSLGANHPKYFEGLSNLALLYQQTQRIPEAAPLYAQSAVGNRRLLERSACYSAESEQFSYLKTFQQSTAQSYSFVQDYPKADLTGEAYNNALFYKGFLLNTAMQLKYSALADSTTAPQFERLRACQRRLTLQYAEPIAARNSSLVADLESEVIDIEKELVRTLLGYGGTLRQINWQEVQAVLKPGEAAVEFINYQYQHGQDSDSIMYAALVLRPGMSVPTFLPLFELKEIQPLLKGASGGNYRRINALYAHGAAGQKTLYDLIWAPLESSLVGVTKVYCSASGLLHQINLGAIPFNSRETFGEHRQLILLGSTRQLVMPKKAMPENKKVLLVGGVRYAADDAAIELANKLASRSYQQAELSDPALEIDSLTRGDSWRFLPESRTEVLELQRLMQAAKFNVYLDTGYAATEESVKYYGQYQNSTAPRVLHFATHGFFFPNPKTLPSNMFSETTLSYKTAENPLLRSGIVLAGAQEIWASGRPPAEREDGVLTAYEISRMNLSATELVVLSACETGLGDIESDEGVYGLQRAFKIAGAKYVLMSLWKVNDQTTREFMTEFYSQWLKKGLGIPEAFRNAQHKMKVKYPEEGYHWAGWVLVG